MRQHQRRENPAGAETHDHGASRQVGTGLAHGLPVHVGRRAHVGVSGEPMQQRGLLCGIGERDVHDVDGQQLGLARVEASLVHLEPGNAVGGNAKARGGQRGELFLGVVFGMVLGVVVHRREREFEFGDPDHGL